MMKKRCQFTAFNLDMFACPSTLVYPRLLSGYVVMLNLGSKECKNAFSGEKHVRM